MFLGFIVIGTGAWLWYVWYVWSSNLPYIGTLKDYRPPLITEIYSDNGEVIGRLWEERRIITSLDQLPKHLIQAFIAAEDSRFYQHEGVDLACSERSPVSRLAIRKSPISAAERPATQT